MFGACGADPFKKNRTELYLEYRTPIEVWNTAKTWQRNDPGVANSWDGQVQKFKEKIETFVWATLNCWDDFWIDFQ